MIRISFAVCNDKLTGFEINGHSGYADEGADIVCASVSSAAYMAANTITEILGVDAEAEVSDAHMYFSVKGTYDRNAENILSGLRLHLRQLCEQYPTYVTIFNDNQ